MFKRVLMASAVVSLFAACSSTQPPAAVVAEPAQPVVVAPVAPAVDAQAAAQAAALARMQAERARLAGESIYFDFDSNAVKADQQAKVAAHAEFLKQNAQQKVQIQGNTDARGSREYNLGLGQRRAESVKQSLEVLGVKDAQLEAVSYGKEKPRAEGSSPADYAENRRADVSYGQ
ncbi:peptidoglycan-associated lipoprotein Pal [Craterilacuibacter sp. RT1T]|uniref:peptidoglycan-associated lipoprotein Pal n=1 Tax=Craterilacuibacter sp. RT1T TaxID=2942211 RepID=UPI0020C05B25|nr:peptidoglycan-associated lipoprotein Pal [Craterilacuibacter sp. RT1T]MCL6263945.1 peptidoglycan-associated lipoprotein Pal [Craterilacuibacter sp. RT1T]